MAGVTRPYGPLDRSPLIITGLKITSPTGTVLVPTVVDIALVPVDSEPGASTEWKPASQTGPGQFEVLVAGADADDTDVAFVMTSSRDAYGRYSAGGLVEIGYLGRVPYRV